MYPVRENSVDRRDDELFTIYVNNLPVELKQDGIAQIFGAYGQVHSLFTPPQANWAYVSYKTYKEAEFAIRSLHERSPLFLNVAFRRKKTQTNTPVYSPPPSNGVPAEPENYRHPPIRVCHNEDHPRFDPRALAASVAQLSVRNSGPDVNCVYPTHCDHNIYNPFESTGPYSDTSAMWSRACMSVDEYGKRWVSGGRGYTRYHIPEPAYPEIEHHVRKLYEKRCPGFYQYGEDALRNDINKCGHCGLETKYRCDQYDRFYCSPKCQVNDSSHLRMDCQNIPNGVGKFDASIIEDPNVKDPNMARKSRVGMEINGLGSLRRPKKVVDTTIAENVKDVEANERSNEKCGSSKSVIETNSRSEINNARPIGTKTDFTKQEKDIAFQRDPRVQKALTNNQASFRNEVEPIVQQVKIADRIMKSTIAENGLTDVRVIVVMRDNKFWVNKHEDIDKLEAMMVELNTKVDNYPRVDNLVVGEIYAFQYETIWHRASILSTNPLKICYIDFGNDESPETNDFRSLKDFTIYPAFAILARLSANSSIKDVKPNMDLSVRVVGSDENGIVEVTDRPEEIVQKSQPEVKQMIQKTQAQVEVKQMVQKAVPEVKQIEAVVEPKVALKKLPNALDDIAAESSGFAEIYVALDSKTYAICVLHGGCMEQYQMVFDTLTKICDAAKKPNGFSPKIGDFVCGKRDSSWLRGFVVALGPPVRLALVDEARVSPVEDVIPMPEGYENICSFGMICTLESNDLALDIEDTREFHVTKIIDDAGGRIVEAVFPASDDKKEIKCSMKTWKPTPEQKGVSVAELKNNSKVYISSYQNERIMYVRSMDDESVERSHRVTQEVAKWAQTAPKLDKPPVVGQLVIAKYVDDNYYRAVVIKVLDNNKIGVSYIDYGNNEITTINDIRALSDNLKEIGSCASKIILKDIKVDGPSTEEVHRYLDFLVGKEQPLICTFDGIPSKDGVTLTTLNGESVNEKVNTYMTPEWKRNDPSKNDKCFLLDDLETTSLGEIGQIVQALPLFPTEPPFKYVIGPYNQEHLAHIMQVMPELMLKYCESAKSHYIPRTSELCLAIYEGSWYRGVCLDRSVSPTQSLIYFIDYGNTEIVDHTKIREMTKDFMSPGALGLSCVIKNLGVQLVDGKVPDHVKRRIEQLIPTNDLVHVKIIKKSTPENKLDCDYEIELPLVRQKLIAEGLAKP